MKLIKNNILGFIIGIIVASSVTVFAYGIASNQISYTPKNGNSDIKTVEEALDKLYENVENNSSYACKILENTSWTFTYKPEGQEFIVPCNGKYKIEVWGSQAGQERYDYLRLGGAYAKGEINLTAGKKLYAYVGNYNLTVDERGFNGGGMTTYRYKDNNNGVGGGATDIRLKNGDWDNEQSLASRIIVAGGSGGGVEPVSGYGYAGGLSSSSVSGLAETTQTTGYAFGKGQDASRSSGGGGYYGGYANGQSASGGSSYVSGHVGCVAITSETDLSPKKVNNQECTDDTIDVECSIHYSGYRFTNTEIIPANQAMPTFDGSSTMTGNKSTGYAKITYIK